MAPHSLTDHNSPTPGVTSNGQSSSAQDSAAVNGHAITNGINGTNGARRRRNMSHLKPTPPNEIHDLICVGFGPASLAIAVALHDAIEAGKLPGGDAPAAPKVLFLEKQPQFAWHAGMLLPGAKMQISFIKDMASLRDPTSKFTFLNYLHQNGRLVEFTNLGTFLPARVEYDDYLRWCSTFFDDVVSYGSEVVSVSPKQTSSANPVSNFTVTSRNAKSGAVTTYQAKNVLFAIGGQPSIPKCLPSNHPRVVHSSQYAHLIPKILTQREAPYRVAVVGAGQSAAEIFNNIQTLYPNSRTTLIMRSEFLKPSDDSPFVNSIFNPSYVDELFSRPAADRRSLLGDARSTNYGVVRLELIEHLYERMYDQRRELGPDSKKWPHRILGSTSIAGFEEVDNNNNNSDKSDKSIRLAVRPLNSSSSKPGNDEEEILDVDLVIAATGYQRQAHLTMMEDVAELLPEDDSSSFEVEQQQSIDGLPPRSNHNNNNDKNKKNYDARVNGRPVRVGRDYGVEFAPGKVAAGSGIWLQGCCEGTHGLSDTLLSILAVRSQEIVDSIFGTEGMNKTAER